MFLLDYFKLCRVAEVLKRILAFHLQTNTIHHLKRAMHMVVEVAHLVHPLFYSPYTSMSFFLLFYLRKQTKNIYVWCKWMTYSLVVFWPQVGEIISLGLITASEVLIALRLVLHYDFVLKRLLCGLKENELFKLLLVSTLKWCKTIYIGGTKRSCFASWNKL